MTERANKIFMRNNIIKIDMLPAALNSIVLAGFGKCGDIVFAKSIANPDKYCISGLLDIAMDFTGVECAINKIHIEDYVLETNVYDHAFVISIGILFMRMMSSNVCLYCPNESFRFILTEDAGEFPSVVFRFHKKRYGQSWLDEDIEHYSSGVCLVDAD